MRESVRKQSLVKPDMSDRKEVGKDEHHLKKEINEEIRKLGYFLEETEEMIEIKVYTEIEIINKRARTSSQTCGILLHKPKS